VETTIALPAADAPARPGLPAPLIRDVLGIAVPAGAFGLTFGALSASTGFTLAQTCALSLLMFTGGSQFALVSAIASGSGPLPATTVAVLLGSRNALYGLRLGGLLRLSRPRRLLAAQLVIDESAAMATGQQEAESGRTAFWATGLAVFVLWNLGTLLGALGGSLLPDPSALGLDAAAPAAFLALLAPRVKERDTRVTALVAVVVVLILVPFTPIGVPVVVAALAAVTIGMRMRARVSKAGR
jgi:4-azaleucine resistance transporter AzlC